MPTFEAMRAGYRTLWNALIVSVTRQSAVDGVAKRINNNRERYERVVESFPGMPWYVVGMWHYRESNLDFRGVLHNGEKILGTGRKTTLVPAGRGPFATWEDAAADALNIKNLRNVRDWTVERIGYESERFNGFGYLRVNVNSPYLWSGSSLYAVGKYVADGRYDPNHVDKQLGVMTIMRRIFDLNYATEPKSKIGLPPEPIGEQPEPSASAGSEKAPTSSKTVWTKITEFAAGGGAAVIGLFTGLDWRVATAIIVVLGIGTIYIIHERLKRDDIDKSSPLARLFGA